jgi:hypothetical protein
MKQNILRNINSHRGMHRLLISATFILVLLVTGCTSSYNSSKNWNRSPASTGRNRCGCFIDLEKNHSIKSYQLIVYAVQA